MENKKKYLKPIIEEIVIDSKDIIATSDFSPIDPTSSPEEIYD